MESTKIILLIDPQSETEEMMRKVFGKPGYDIVRFPSGKEALEFITEQIPYLIISEWETLDLSGTEVLHILNTDPLYDPHRKVPFLIYTEKVITDPKIREQLFEKGLRGLFTKPFGTEEFRQVIQNLCVAHTASDRNLELRQEVKRSKYRYRDFLENANDFIFTLDRNGCFDYLNNRFTSLTGFEKEDWLGNSFLEIIAASDRESALNSYRMAHQGKARIFESRILSSQKHSDTVLSINITPIFEHGSIVGSIGIARDVTDQKKMEKEILDLTNFNESIIQSMEAGLLTTDLLGRVTSLNAGGERILGWKLVEILGKELNSVLRPRESETLLSNLPPPGSLPYSRETELTVKSGKKIAIGFTATDRIDNQNMKVGTIVSFRDISQLKQMQSEVIRMDRLASLGVLASGIAHEIKNPLAGIKTMAQACEEEFEDEDPRIEYLTRIVRQVNRLDDLLKTFFAYAKPKPPNRKYYQVSDILKEVLHLVDKKLKSANIQFQSHFASSLPAVLVDAQQMQQVFLNLFLNSVDAMVEGGQLSIDVSAYNYGGGEHHMDSGENQDNPSAQKWVTIRFKDTGSGIAEDKLGTIFDPFYTTKPNGLGLGLSIVYRIIHEHGGDIRVDSKKDKGTCFTIILPTGDDLWKM
jgi:PAS domain S-box-containing protein